MRDDPRQWQRISWLKANCIPCVPGCYALLDANDTILYIGRSKLLWKRLHKPSRHKGFGRASNKHKDLFIAWCEGWSAYDNEKELIKYWKPPLCNCQ